MAVINLNIIKLYEDFIKTLNEYTDYPEIKILQKQLFLLFVIVCYL